MSKTIPFFFSSRFSKIFSALSDSSRFNILTTESTDKSINITQIAKTKQSELPENIDASLDTKAGSDVDSGTYPNGCHICELEIDKDMVVNSFKEKPHIEQGWINGGFLVVEPSFFDRIDNDLTVLEAEPLSNAEKDGLLMAFKHEGFWQCMDTKRDRDNLEDLWISSKAPWVK